MVALHNKYKDKGFTVLAFPCNQFLKQEDKTEAEIKEFVKQFKVEFPVFSKIDVNGEHTHPVFKFLKTAFPGDVNWNFAAKFIVDKDGIPIKRFGSVESDSWESIDAFIGEVLSGKRGDSAPAAVVQPAATAGAPDAAAK